MLGCFSGGGDNTPTTLHRLARLTLDFLFMGDKMVRMDVSRHHFPLLQGLAWFMPSSVTARGASDQGTCGRWQGYAKACTRTYRQPGRDTRHHDHTLMSLGRDPQPRKQPERPRCFLHWAADSRSAQRYNRDRNGQTQNTVFETTIPDCLSGPWCAHFCITLSQV